MVQSLSFPVSNEDANVLNGSTCSIEGEIHRQRERRGNKSFPSVEMNSSPVVVVVIVVVVLVFTMRLSLQSSDPNYESSCRVKLYWPFELLHKINGSIAGTIQQKLIRVAY